MNDLGIIKRDVLSEIERERRYAQINLERVIGDSTIDYEQKVLMIKNLVVKLADSEVLVNATNKIFVDDTEQQPSAESQRQTSNVVESLNQPSHSE